MATTTTTAPLGVHEKLNRAPSRLGILIFGGVMVLGLQLAPPMAWVCPSVPRTSYLPVLPER